MICNRNSYIIIASDTFLRKEESFESPNPSDVPGKIFVELRVFPKLLFLFFKDVICPHF